MALTLLTVELTVEVLGLHPDRAWRVVILLELGLLALCGTALHLGHREVLRKAGLGFLWWAALPFAWVTFVTFAAIALNLALGEPLSLGAKVFCVAIAPAVACAVTIVALLAHRNRRTGTRTRGA